MATRNEVHIVCDYINPSTGRICGFDEPQSEISPNSPVMRLTIKVEMVDCNGATTLVDKKVDICSYDTYWALSKIHDDWQAEVERRIQAAKTSAAVATETDG